MYVLYQLQMCMSVALTMGVISVHSYCRISILFSLVNIILLEEQQSTLIVYHGCISLYTRRLSATLLEKPGGAIYMY